MGGVAGHAGLFSTAADLAQVRQMMLNRGELNGMRVFSPADLAKFTSPQTPPDQPILRGLGWDIDSPIRGNRGELFPIGSYGHTGFTGTSLVDRSDHSDLHHSAGQRGASLNRRAITLSCAAAWPPSRPRRSVSMLPGRGPHRLQRNAVAGPGCIAKWTRKAEVLTGLDVLEEQKFPPLQGKRVGLITNHTGIDRRAGETSTCMLAAGVKGDRFVLSRARLCRHGGSREIADTEDPATGIRFSASTAKPCGRVSRHAGTEWTCWSSTSRTLARASIPIPPPWRMRSRRPPSADADFWCWTGPTPSRGCMWKAPCSMPT